jgi:hypothetical protein
VRGDFNQIRPIVTNQHTRKTFFAKALAGLVGAGFLGTRLQAKTAPVQSSAASEASAAREGAIAVRAEARAVARSVESL